MEKNYRVTTFVMDSGERYCMVVDRSSGLPLYYPTLFLTTQIRNRGDAFSTMLAAASNLVMLLSFVESRDIDLEQRFLTKDFFRPHELDDLRDFAQRKQGRMPSKALSNPWLDDELAKDVDAGYNSLDDLKSAIRGDMTKARETARQGDLDDKIVLRLIELTPFEVPKRLVNYEIQEMLKQTEENLKRSGLSFESAGIDLKELVDGNREIAEKRVKGDFLLKKIAEVEEIKLADEDIERGYQRIAGQYRMTVEEVKGYFSRREELLPFMNELHNEKVLNFLREQTIIVDKVAEPVQEAEEKPTE